VVELDNSTSSPGPAPEAPSSPPPASEAPPAGNAAEASKLDSPPSFV
jgi:hypothetical protein